MQSVQLIHWDPEQAAGRAKLLEAAGYAVGYEPVRGPDFLRKLGNNPPDAIVIDLSRLPSQGRDIAVLLRKRLPTRHVPLVFVGGKSETVARIQGLLPDAFFASWDKIDKSLQVAIANPPVKPVVPKSPFDAYAGKPLAAKLGIKPNAVVTLVDAPEGFEQVLGELPKGVQVHRQIREENDLTLWFTRARSDLDRGIAQMAAAAKEAPLWIAWPKKASGKATDLTQQQVREVGLAAGLVDYKICSIDKTWSGLLFTRRKPKK
ncbi:MAG: response regulator [Anaerolineales bacterium]|jgi:CheY-like chemotaxis protein